ncbi:MAG TPA: phospho-sugar mutase, partial [Spirochaetia bacterium]|nr:phospho-sugar mutase [Spirochaetia bacterium]
IRSMDRAAAVKSGMLLMIDREIDDAFVAMVKGHSLRPELIRERGKELTVVYTPLHGAGRAPVERVLGELGIRVLTVPEQREPDGNFPTVDYPNPEEASALKLALDLGKREAADLVLGTDPDSDRLGIAVPGARDFVLITGNQLGALLADYIFSSLEELGRMPERPAFVKTIVTTNLQRRIAEAHGVAVYDVLTGFKYIADMMKRFETSGEHYLFGAEESYGFLVETEVRDKDAVSAALLATEMALYHRSQGRTVLDALARLYLKYGYFEELLISRGFSGESGLTKMKQLMDRLRNDPPRGFGGKPVDRIKDYQSGSTTTFSTSGSPAVTRDIDLPTSNVLQFVLADETIVTARPSGTEPKIKFYASACTEPGREPAGAKAEVGAKMRAIEAEIDAIIESVG